MGAGSSTVSSGVTASSQPPNACCSMFRPHPVIVKAHGSEKVLVWKLISEKGYHMVRLEHDVFSGRRLILADNIEVFWKPRTLLDTGSNHSFTLAGNMKCQVQIVEQGLQFGYALTINEQPFARYRAEFWKYAALWYLPRNGRLAPRVGSGVWPEAAASAAAASAYAHASALPPAALPASSESSTPSPAEPTSPPPKASPRPPRAVPPSPSIIPRFHTVVVMSHPQLTVLLNGRVIDLQSSFSSMHEHEAGLPEHESTTHAFVLPKEEGDDEDAVDVHCQLQVWIDKNDASLAAGQVQSHIPRDKRHGRNRYALRMDGTLVAQAPSPLVGVHGSLQNSAASASGSNDAAHQQHVSSGNSGGFGGELITGRQHVRSDSPSLSPMFPPSDFNARSSSKPLPAPVSIAAAAVAASSGSATHSPATPQPFSDFGMLDIHAPTTTKA